MQKCKDCNYRVDNTCTKIKYDDSHGKWAGTSYVICVINHLHPEILQCKTSPRWCPLREVKEKSQ